MQISALVAIYALGKVTAWDGKLWERNTRNKGMKRKTRSKVDKSFPAQNWDQKATKSFLSSLDFFPVPFSLPFHLSENWKLCQKKIKNHLSHFFLLPWPFSIEKMKWRQECNGSFCEKQSLIKTAIFHQHIQLKEKPGPAPHNILEIQASPKTTSLCLQQKENSDTAWVHVSILGLIQLAC